MAPPLRRRPGPDHSDVIGPEPDRLRGVPDRLVESLQLDTDTGAHVHECVRMCFNGLVVEALDQRLRDVVSVKS